MNLDDAILLESYTKLKSFVDLEQASCIQNWIDSHPLRVTNTSRKRRIEIIDDSALPNQKRLMIDDKFIGQIETLIDTSSGFPRVKCEIK